MVKFSNNKRPILLTWDSLDVAFASISLTYVVFHALGGLWYLAGLTMSAYLILLAVFTFIPMLLLGLLTTTILIWRVVPRWAARILVSSNRVLLLRFTAVFLGILALVMPVFLRGPGYVPFIWGFKHRMDSKANIPEIRRWLSSLGTNATNLNQRIPEEKRPEALRILNAPYCAIETVSGEHRAVSVVWGSGFGHWGMTVGRANYRLESGLGNRYVVVLEPGAYVWHEIQ